jgi:hypothetical protein
MQNKPSEEYVSRLQSKSGSEQDFEFNHFSHL